MFVLHRIPMVIIPDSGYRGPTVFGFWDDLKIYYGISGTAPNRITTFEFYESHFSAPTQYYHLQIIFYENLPNIVTCFYMETFDGGASATIGVQGMFVDFIFFVNYQVGKKVFALF